MGADGSYARADIDRLHRLQRGKCAGCKCVLVKYHIDHVTPLALGGSNWPSNLQLLCPTCNMQKNAKPPIKWQQERGYLL